MLSYAIDGTIELKLPQGEKTITARDTDFLFSFNGNPVEAQVSKNVTDAVYKNSQLTLKIEEDVSGYVFLGDIIFLDSFSDTGVVSKVVGDTVTVNTSYNDLTITAIIVPKSNLIAEGESLIFGLNAKRVFVTGTGNLEILTSNTNTIKKKI